MEQYDSVIDPRENVHCTVEKYGLVSQSGINIHPRELIQEEWALTTIYLNFGYQISKTLERVQYKVDSKIEKITSIKLAEICLTHAEKEQFHMKLKRVNFGNTAQNKGHLPQYRLRVKEIEVEAAFVHIHLEIQAWNN